MEGMTVGARAGFRTCLVWSNSAPGAKVFSRRRRSSSVPNFAALVGMAMHDG